MARDPIRRFAKLVAALAGACLPAGALAQLYIHEDLSGVASRYDWRALNGACLTAGNNTGSIPACVGLPYYGSAIQVGGVSGRLPDPPGLGALRLTNGDVSAHEYGVTSVSGTNATFQTGAVVSNFTFPSHRGLRVTFTSVTYGGNRLDGHGADGMSFFLTDGSRSPDVGASGGSLGYSCKNLLVGFDRATGSFDAFPGNPLDIPDTQDGVDRGYLGIGIDEYGNFANPGDNTDTGPGFRPGRISLRGAGDTRWERLNRDYPGWYPASLDVHKRAEAVRNTCATGKLWNYSGTTVTAEGLVVPVGVNTDVPLDFNYRHLAFSDLPDGTTIENQQAVDRPLRGAAVPITYSLNLSQDGLLDFSYSINGGTTQPVVTGRRISDDNGPVPATFRFGFSGSTGGGSNVHEITCFRAEPMSTASTSAGTTVPASARVRAGSQVFLSFNHPANWWGQLKAHDVLEDPSTDDLSIRPTANWDAHCTLTGGPCTAMGPAAPAVTAQGSDERSVITWNGSRGVPLRWDSLTAAQQAALATGDPAAGTDRLAYLRGDRGREMAAGGSLRTRSGVLGDMPDSSPTWVGAPSSPYEGPWADRLTGTAMPENGGQSYADFKRLHATRQQVVYVGANDGLLHGFRAGSPNDGRELLAYMPGEVLSAIHSTTPALDFSHPRYAHNLYVDATPGVGDLRFGGQWRTWLVGGLGPARNAGGPVNDRTAAVTGAIYALDVTDPASFGEASAAGIVRGEWTSSTLTCTNVAGCGAHLGAVIGAPAIRRLHNGSWAALFGNGLNSAAGTAGLFIMLVDPASGAISFRYLDTGVAGPGGVKNGIANVAAADLDGDHVTDYVYAGDALGKLWRFDLTAADPARWAVSAAPVFQTETGQPITNRVTIASVPGKGALALPRVVLAFGTGEQLPQTLSGPAVHAPGTQALYGVWDADLDGWNARTSGARFASLSSPGTVRADQLTAQAVTGTAPGTDGIVARTVSRNAVCWRGATECETGNDRMGWKLALPAAAEQVLHNPVLSHGMLLVNTTIPERSSPMSCNQQAPGGFTMALSVGSGGAAASSFFPDSGLPLVAGLSLGATGSPTVMTSRRKAFLVQQTVSGRGAVTRINPTFAGAGGRLNWLQVR